MDRQQPQPETQPPRSEAPESQEQTEVQQGFRALWESAVGDTMNMGPLGRVFLAVIILIVLFKLTPILDLLFYMFQIVVLPTLFLVAWGVISKETYDAGIGWVNAAIEWGRNKREGAEGT
jgi:hypothetical protein